MASAGGAVVPIGAEIGAEIVPMGALMTPPWLMLPPPQPPLAQPPPQPLSQVEPHPQDDSQQFFAALRARIRSSKLGFFSSQQVPQETGAAQQVGAGAQHSFFCLRWRRRLRQTATQRRCSKHRAANAYR